MQAKRHLLAWLLPVLVCSIAAADVGGGEEFGFFDYLGAMVEDDGEWLDPLAMDADVAKEDAESVSADAAVEKEVMPQGEDDE